MSQQPIRVLHVISAMTNGGAESYIMNQYRRMDRNKIQFDFLTSRPGEYAFNDEIKRMGGKIYLIKPPTEQGAIGFVKDIVKIIKNDPSIKVIHAHTLLNCGLAMLAGYLGGLKIRISHSHSALRRPTPTIKRKLYDFSMRPLIKLLSTKYFACGIDAGINLFGKNFEKYKKSKFIPNSIDLSRFIHKSPEQNKNLRKSLNIPDNAAIYTNIGRFTEQKNQPYSLKIAQCLKNMNHRFKMLLIGEGKWFDYIRKMAKDMELEDYVIIPGPRSDIPDIFSITDVFILPSLFEGLPVTGIEAQASGIPCIFSDKVTKQADIGMNMCSFIGIEESDISKWADECIKLENVKYPDQQPIFERLKSLGYDSTAGAEYLSRVYLGLE